MAFTRTTLFTNPRVRSYPQIITPPIGRSVIDDADDDRARDADDDRARDRARDDRNDRDDRARGRGSIGAATARGDADRSIARLNDRTTD